MPSRCMHELVRDQKPLVMPPETSVKDAAAAMLARRVGAVLVARADGRLLGIFTGRDALRCLAGADDTRTCTLASVMTASPLTLPPEADAMEALRLLNDAGVRHMPIVQNGKVAGIVSRYDFRAMEHGRLEEETGYFEMLR
ncbi:CBS domain-containing protein [Rhodovarius crocodyli]|uniref:CBS domain-containing protein n=1 Tax=Rhodovarius crocodyli TaxID=1979269 RepID=A0A437MMW4_9PROT|nr:CBS domain-containing protein [Rhodovarius crocodyli]RVT98995.1 CBS domain-containing protein [Rhodovarius crocodyli]